ncbi:alpha/beta hydrolase family protein [Streptomyces sp. NPDC059534]|uniref:alpha/beta hydrolase family protein n=1 Tax=Streptomyces sp. NPDC059534 TaxID=3346859 RepID=UPI0036C66A38
MAIFFPRTATFEFEFLRTLGHARYGGADVGECLATAGRIDDGDFGSWYEEWTRTADRVREQAGTSLARGRTVSARDALMRASNYYRSADFFLHGDRTDPRIAVAREASVTCYRQAAGLFDAPLERVGIPYEDTTLPGYFYAPDTSGRVRPTLVMHNGFDGTGDECYFMGGRAAQERGYNVLAFEGPGQGEVIHDQGLPFRPDWENVVGPVLDFLLKRPEVDADRVALLGISMGGVLAPRAAAFDDRIGAVITFDGVYDMFAFSLGLVPLPAEEATRRLLADADDELDALLDEVIAENSVARWSTDHGMWVLDAPTPRTFLGKLYDYHLRDGIAERVTCPVLVMKSETDFAFEGQPEALYAHLPGPKGFAAFTNEEGAGAHCQVGAMNLAAARMFDWLDGVFADLS